ncbi:putative anion-transporting ATPase [Gordonia amarae NBRC 15530]|uniref:Putative anion-transporting ATPase n=1 Tax=Gordonia amarae NBRC 15530 TaxID=1075090 RepID=G7GPQ0_9ACTN|nr:putative anion-transporting ATPase [Gordonia amarae NBRC 15530]
MSSVATAGVLGLAHAGSGRPGGRRSAGSPVLRPVNGDDDTLLITLDRLSRTAQRLGVFRRPNEVVPVSDGLYLLSLDRLALLEETWAQFSAILSDATARSAIKLPGVGVVAGVDPGELVQLPGIEDFLLLRRVRDEATSGRWRRIVLDCSGAGDPMVFLRAPSVLHQIINRLWPRHLRIAAAAERPVLAQLSAAVDAIDTDCLDVAELICDPTSAAVTLVVTADDRGADLLESSLATIDLMGLALRSVVINRTGLGATGDEGPGTGPDPVVAGIREVLAADESDGVRVYEVATAPTPLDRPARLRKLGVTLDEPSGVGQGSSTAKVGTLSGTGLDSRFELVWRQRLPDPDTLRLGRADDDLLVTIDGFRYPVRLPSVLRRCDAVDAQWDDDRLRVVFAPDPAVWPVR